MNIGYFRSCLDFVQFLEHFIFYWFFFHLLFYMERLIESFKQPLNFPSLTDFSGNIKGQKWQHIDQQMRRRLSCTPIYNSSMKKTKKFQSSHKNTINDANINVDANRKQYKQRRGNRVKEKIICDDDIQRDFKLDISMCMKGGMKSKRGRFLTECKDFEAIMGMQQKQNVFGPSKGCYYQNAFPKIHRSKSQLQKHQPSLPKNSKKIPQQNITGLLICKNIFNQEVLPIKMPLFKPKNKINKLKI